MAVKFNDTDVLYLASSPLSYYAVIVHFFLTYTVAGLPVESCTCTVEAAGRRQDLSS